MSPKILDLQLKSRPGIALAIPCEATLPRKAVMSVLLMMAHSWKPGLDHLLTLPKVATVQHTRNAIVRHFLELPENVQFLVMIDSDMVVPTNLLDIWVTRPEYRLPFISAYCTSKEFPYKPIPSMYAGMFDQDGMQMHGYKAITDMQPNTGLQRVDGVGMAAVCIRRDVLEQMTPPWFAFDEGYSGEDLYFCSKLGNIITPDAPNGVWVTVDTHVQVGHVGEHVAYPDDWFANKANSGVEEEQYVDPATLVAD